MFFAEAVGKRASVPIVSGLPSSLITAAYFYVRLIPRDFFTFASLGSVPTPSGRVPGFVPLKTTGWTFSISLSRLGSWTASSGLSTIGEREIPHHEYENKIRI